MVGAFSGRENSCQCSQFFRPMGCSPFFPDGLLMFLTLFPEGFADFCRNDCFDQLSSPLKTKKSPEKNSSFFCKAARFCSPP